MLVRPQLEANTLYLNVDVEVVSRVPLGRIVSALGRNIFVHYAGPIPGGHAAYFSLASAHGRSADVVARRLAALISRLRGAERLLWQGARSRCFNVGVQGGLAPRSHELLLSARTVAQLASLKAHLVVTTYGARVPPVRRRKGQPALGAA